MIILKHKFSWDKRPSCHMIKCNLIYMFLNHFMPLFMWAGFFSIISSLRALQSFILAFFGPPTARLQIINRNPRLQDEAVNIEKNRLTGSETASRAWMTDNEPKMSCDWSLLFSNFTHLAQVTFVYTTQ